MAALSAHLDPQRRALLSAMLARAPFEGWTQPMMAAAGRDVGLDGGGVSLAAPGGVVEMLDVWAAACDVETQSRLAATDLAALKIRERVTFGVRARLEAAGDEHREAVRRALARLAAPDAAPRAAQMGWRAADTIWRGIGDTSTDGNFYSKRVILSGVLATVTPVWAQADGPEDDAPWRALDQRIAMVMQFEKAKAQWRQATAGLPSLVDLAARLRYPR